MPFTRSTERPERPSKLVAQEWRPGEEDLNGGWTRERLIAMDDDFVVRMEKALADGREKLPTGSRVALRRGIGFVSGLQFRD